MTRSHGPFGPPGTPLRRRPGDDAFGAPQQPAGHWPPQPPHPQQGHGYGDYAAAPQPQHGYHFPPPEPQPAYGYSNPQLLAPQQWPQQGEPQAYEVNYQPYAGDPGPFQHAGPEQHHQGYADADAEYGDDYYEDEEPRRGKRWILIVGALVGAIGVGGALAYTYRSLVAPKSRLEAVRSDPNVKVRAGLPDTDSRPPVRIAETPEAAAPEPPTDAALSGSDNRGPRTVKTIPVMPDSEAQEPSAPPVTPAIPGIVMYQQPSVPAPPARAAPPPAVEAPVQAEPEPTPEPEPSGRLAVDDTPPPPPPPAAEEPQNEPLAAAPPPPRQERTAAIAPRPPAARPREASSGLGYVAVLFSKKSSMDALKGFADLQQKYGEVLGDKTPDVQEADLSARGLGTMYRLVVGPPGSHNAARGVCTQLRAAGYEGCWVKEY